jgi:hypothetical protein
MKKKDSKQGTRYINEMMTCSCFPDLLRLKIFPNGKEITESCSAYNFFRQYYKEFDFSDPDVTIISVGDGCTPRTAGLFAFRSNWECISIDPNLKWSNTSSYDFTAKVKRLTCIRERIEGCKNIHFKKLALVHVHSHASLEISCNKFTADKRIVLAMPCCVPQVRERLPDFSYVDESIWSPQNKINVWYDLQ